MSIAVCEVFDNGYKMKKIGHESNTNRPKTAFGSVVLTETRLIRFLSLKKGVASKLANPLKFGVAYGARTHDNKNHNPALDSMKSTAYSRIWNC